ncbi:MAG: DNA-processing protein DprA [Candidatus Nanopelagicales bacterium]|jgi:DNA processing protein|nr:DNA-processing protein DprA [Candidatus Nanopelagicales bacterium]
MDERTARIALACVTEPGSAGLAERVAELGPAHVLHEVLRGGGGPVGTAAGRIDPEDVPAMLTAMARAGVRVLVPGDTEFPSHLTELPDPPLALWVRGPLDLRVAAMRSVAVVGSRACTPYGERATTAIVDGLVATGWTIVSGGAFGIDAAAHRAALAADGCTVAILACGVDLAYPRAHEALLCRIADLGAVVSELPPGSPPLRHRFLARNRLIAGMARGTLVVEAARRSGALATANRTLDIGRPLMAVPGPVTSMASSGTNRLLHEELARAVCDGEQAAAVLLGSPGAGPVREPSAGGRDGPAPVDLSPEAQRVLDALPSRGGRSVEDVAARSGLPAATALAHLGILELQGHVRRAARGWCRRA